MSTEKIGIGFLGYGIKALDCLMEHPMFEVKYFFVPRARVCRDVYEAWERYRDCLEMEIVEDSMELAERFSQITDVDCFLMNACSIILKRDALSGMKVFNIHPGDLHSNRGHQPHCWTVLLGERKTKIVLHVVHEEIDVGEVVKSAEIEVFAEDGEREVLERLEEQIPVLLDGLYRHLRENAGYEEIVRDGMYRRIMVPDDYEIHPAMDAVEIIERKIRSRNLHHGAFLQYGNSRIYVEELLSFKEDVKRREGVVTMELNEKKGIVCLHAMWRTMVFRLHHVEDISEYGGRKGDEV